MIERRPMTPNERAILAQMSERPRFTSGWIWLGMWFLCLFLPWLFLLRAGQDNTPVLGFGSLILVGYAIAERWWKRRIKRLPPSSQQDLAEGQVEVTRVEATDAVEVEEVEDLGLNFFIDVGDSQLLFLTGQYLYELAYVLDDQEKELPGKFPNRKFSIVLAPHSGHLLSFDCQGEPLRPSRCYRIPDGERRFFELKNGQLVPGRLSTLPEDLRKLGIRVECPKAATDARSEERL